MRRRVPSPATKPWMFNQNIMFALTSVGCCFSNIVCKKWYIDMNNRAGEFKEPDWFLNRKKGGMFLTRKDYNFIWFPNFS